MTRSSQLDAWEEAFHIEGVTDLRLDLGLWRTIHDWVFDLTRGEQAGVLLARTDAVGDGDLLVGERFLPVTEEYVLDRAQGLRYDGRFNLRVAEAAERSGCGAILIHAHQLERPPIPSSFDTAYGVDFLAFMRRRRPDGVHGLLVVGENCVRGVCETPTEHRAVRRLVASGAPRSAFLMNRWLTRRLRIPATGSSWRLAPLGKRLSLRRRSPWSAYQEAGVTSRSSSSTRVLGCSSQSILTSSMSETFAASLARYGTTLTAPAR